MQLECFYKNAFSGVQRVRGIDKKTTGHVHGKVM